MKSYLSLILITLAGVCHAQSKDDVASKVLAQHKGGPEIRPLNWLNENFLERQRTSVNELVATHFGQRLHDNKDDLALLQRVVNEELIAPKDTLQLQALGVVLGDVFVKEIKQFQWFIYEDELGATQAVCIKDTPHCLFPITMLSRRMEVGLKPDVNKIFQSAITDLADYLPKTPYTAD
ncbi:uncharacterized protein DUF3806 [Alteromonadaceae bacterium 2753L.S.0a.02]|nr:uncharacterized protein DUF3806 [Alteromonadaceae bacterium 2753L.S.0a.02]